MFTSHTYFNRRVSMQILIDILVLDNEEVTVEHKKITGEKDIYVAVDPLDVITSFESEVAKTVLFYYQGTPDNGTIIYEIHVELTREFIDDTYNLVDDTSNETREETEIEAFLEVGERAFSEKRGTPKGYDKIVGTKANGPLHYTTLPGDQKNHPKSKK